MDSYGDCELVEQFRQGKIEGYNELFKRYREKVYWIARRILGNHNDADDVVQDVFIKVYHKLKSFRGESEFYTWIYRITVNTALNVAYKNKVKDFLSLDVFKSEIAQENKTPDEIHIEKEKNSLIEQAINKLPPKQKAVFIMRFYDELSYEEIAKILKKSVGGSKANYFQALQKIKNYVRNEIEK